MAWDSNLMFITSAVTIRVPGNGKPEPGDPFVHDRHGSESRSSASNKLSPRTGDFQSADIVGNGYCGEFQLRPFGESRTASALGLNTPRTTFLMFKHSERSAAFTWCGNPSNLQAGTAI